MEKNRLEMFPWLEDELKEKYYVVQKEIEAAQNMPSQEIERRGARISFVAPVCDGAVLLDLDAKKKHGELYSIPTPLDANLLEVAGDEAEPLIGDWAVVKKLHIYVPADKEDMPHITRADVVARIPQEYLPYVRGFSFSVHKNFFEENFNIMADAYEYDITLLGL